MAFRDARLVGSEIVISAFAMLLCGAIDLPTVLAIKVVPAFVQCVVVGGALSGLLLVPIERSALGGPLSWASVLRVIMPTSWLVMILSSRLLAAAGLLGLLLGVFAVYVVLTAIGGAVAVALLVRMSGMSLKDVVWDVIGMSYIIAVVLIALADIVVYPVVI